MPKVSIYLPDALYDEIKRRELPMSRVAQRAFVAALRENQNSAWVAAARRRPLRESKLCTESLMSEVDEDFGS
jgi:post-segregation antitoxin (ccd killing protein)